MLLNARVRLGASLEGKRTHGEAVPDVHHRYVEGVGWELKNALASCATKDVAVVPAARGQREREMKRKSETDLRKAATLRCSTQMPLGTPVVPLV